MRVASLNQPKTPKNDCFFARFFHSQVPASEGPGTKYQLPRGMAHPPSRGHPSAPPAPRGTVLAPGLHAPSTADCNSMDLVARPGRTGLRPHGGLAAQTPPLPIGEYVSKKTPYLRSAENTSNVTFLTPRSVKNIRGFLINMPTHARAFVQLSMATVNVQWRHCFFGVSRQSNQS